MTAPADKALAQAVLHEIEDIHGFFVQWFGGRVDKTEARFERFRAALDTDFAQVNPSGALRSYATILRDVWQHWNMFPGDPNFRMWIAHARIHHVLPGGHAVATYEEWHDYQGKQVGRTCTALLCRREATPTGIAWLQMHESLLAD
jgi:hypothetical protein